MKATIAVLTYNGQEFIDDILSMCQAQEANFDYEILVIDSGSTDKTLDIIKNYEGVGLHEIPNEEFGHGKTRNLAAELGNGEFMVYLTHDAVPAHSQWLASLLEPFAVSPKIKAVMGKQAPRPNCNPKVKREITSVFQSFGPDQAIMIQRKHPLIQDQAAIDASTFFSDVNSAVRREFLLNEIPYQDVEYAEDQALGIDIYQAGHLKAYAPLGTVYHSHNYSPFKYLRRKYDEAVGLRKTTSQAQKVGLREWLWGLPRGIAADAVFTVKDRDYSLLVKLKWLVLVPFYNLFHRLALWLGSKEALPGWLDNFLSLEAKQKQTKS